MGVEESLLRRVAVNAWVYDEERHRAIQKAASVWRTDTAATDKALRYCVLGSALSVIEGMGVKHDHLRDALAELGRVGFSGYAIGRGLLTTESARLSYSKSPLDERDNAIRIHDRSEAWSNDMLMNSFSASEDFMGFLRKQARSWPFGNIVGIRRAKPVLLATLVNSVAFAIAEEDLFGPFPRGNAV
jgi:hypothetical protein